ncbi:DUF4224 domain-containing protein [Burkholderia arboris]|nr:DUF4224 domain-containing protein [Burkholderia arboris]MCA8036508.1 DUF4224 domain-containing protein [Burkholderia arboris]
MFFEWSSIFRDHADQNKVFRLEIHGFTMNCDTSAARDNCHRQVDHFLESNSQFISYPRITNFFSIGATPFLRQRDRSMSDYLTAHELADLVGCKPNQRAAMTRWLDLNHWRFVVDKTGLPKVARAYRDQKLGLSTKTQTTRHDAGPNLQAFC